MDTAAENLLFNDLSLPVLTGQFLYYYINRSKRFHFFEIRSYSKAYR